MSLAAVMLATTNSELGQYNSIAVVFSWYSGSYTFVGNILCHIIEYLDV